MATVATALTAKGCYRGSLLILLKVTGGGGGGGGGVALNYKSLSVTGNTEGKGHPHRQWHLSLSFLSFSLSFSMACE